MQNENLLLAIIKSSTINEIPTSRTQLVQETASSLGFSTSSSGRAPSDHALSSRWVSNIPGKPHVVCPSCQQSSQISLDTSLSAPKVPQCRPRSWSCQSWGWERHFQYLIWLTFNGGEMPFVSPIPNSVLALESADKILFCFEGINICKPGFRESLYPGWIPISLLDGNV